MHNLSGATSTGKLRNRAGIYNEICAGVSELAGQKSEAKFPGPYAVCRSVPVL